VPGPLIFFYDLFFKVHLILLLILQTQSITFTILWLLISHLLYYGQRTWPVRYWSSTLYQSFAYGLMPPFVASVHTPLKTINILCQLGIHFNLHLTLSMWIRESKPLTLVIVFCLFDLPVGERSVRIYFSKSVLSLLLPAALSSFAFTALSLVVYICGSNGFLFHCLFLPEYKNPRAFIRHCVRHDAMTLWSTPFPITSFKTLYFINNKVLCACF
jgi:hypothetical protein